MFLSVFFLYPFCVPACNTPPANNETGQASEESSENLESTAGEGGEVDASSGDQLEILTSGGESDNEETYIENPEFGEDLPKQKYTESIKAGEEIPISPDDLQDVADESLSSDTVADKNDNIPKPPSSHVEL